MNVPCPDSKCTGCAACAGACPRGCIELKEDAYGELHPEIDVSRCVSCGRCAAACPANDPPAFHSPLACYAAFRADSGARRKSASGGVGAAIAEYVVREKRGVVFGTAYDAGLVPVTVAVEDIDGLEALKGSKYAHSVVPVDLYRRMRGLLDEGRFVVYIATPCQIAAAIKAIGPGRENFVAVDLICHGVAPTRYFADSVAALKAKKRYRGLDDITFRGNDGSGFALSLWSGGKLLSRRRWDESPYFAGFMLGVTLRENCYSCMYARPERVSDVTIGDFIGLGSEKPFPYPSGNVSSVTVNTGKGAEFYSGLLAATPSLLSVGRDYSERLRYRPSLLEPFARHALTGKFRLRYLRGGTVKALAQTLGPRVVRNRFFSAARRLAGVPRGIASRIYRFAVCGGKKSVAVVTWRSSENYGTSLQAFALEWKIRSLGYRTRIVSSVKTSFSGRDRLLGVLKSFGILSAAVWLKRILSPAAGAPPSLRKRKLAEWSRRVHRSADVAYPHELKRLLRTTDCFVTGSDQIWNSYYSFDPAMYLAFAGGRRRVAYASSVGTASVNPVHADEVRFLLGKFAAIGVREKSAADMLRKFLGRDDVVQVLDPLLLLTAEEWSAAARPGPGGYMLVYLIGTREEYAKQALDVKARSGIDRVVVVPSAENPFFRIDGCEVADSADPFEFASLVRNAALVCTDSFHATALAMTFSVPFVEFVRFDDADEKSQNSRIYELLERYGLGGRLYDRGEWNAAIDFSSVQRRLADDREKSIAYLKKAIDG